MSNYGEMMEALRQYREAMRSFVVDNLKSTYGELWWSMGVAKHFKVHELTRLEGIFEERDTPTNPLPQNVAGMADMLDINHFKVIIEGNWKNVFKDKLGRKSVMDGWIAEVDAARDPLAHWAGGDVDQQAALRFIDTCRLVVAALDKPKSDDIQLIYNRVKAGSADATPPPAKSAVTGLKPWREVIVPHPDVRAGVYVKAEFAAHLGEVQKGNASSEYGDPAEFFARTYVTEGLHQLLLGVVKRMRGTGGDPVIDLKTAFGGGKTHSMLAAYHLANAPDAAATNSEVAAIFEAAGGPPPKVNVSVFVGTDFDPATPKRIIEEAGGVEVQTMWGEMAYQLAGLAGYKLVQEHDGRGIAPGANVLEELFALAGPSVILIDELVAYLRNIPSTTRKDTPGGTYGGHMTFCQALTEATKKTDNVALLASIPMTKIEYGDARGEEMANQISNIFQRVGAPWQPVGAREAFEVVRRRLFGSLVDSAERDRTCETFFKLYREGTAFPAECREPAYLELMKSSYPLHPEIFERLYEDWAGNIDRFQRTRGVLRLMADVIHRLWDTKDSDPMILPGSLPMYTANVRQQLIGYLGDTWSPPFDADVDGDNCEAALVERSNPRFGQIQACRRLTRTIFLGSVPGKRNAGLEVARIMLGTVQPNEGVEVYNDALRALGGKLSFLYGTDNRYRFEVRPNLNKVASDRISRVTDEEAHEDIRRRLREMRDLADFSGVHSAPKSPSDVEDAQTARLVILGPEVTHKKEEPASTAQKLAGEILESRGTTPRIYKNMLVFLAADAEALASTVQETKTFIGWHSIASDGKTGAMALDKDQLNESNNRRDVSGRTVDSRLLEAYKWLLVPSQEGTSPIAWSALSLSGGGLGSIGSLAQRAGNKLIVDGLLIKDWSPIHLKSELDRWIWKDGEPHVGLRQVWAYLSTYLYFSRLKDQEVLREAVKQGVKSRDYFGYADGVDGEKYLGLVFGEPARIVVVDDSSVLVRPEVAAKQAEPAQPVVDDGEGEREKAKQGSDGTVTLHDKPVRRFHATAKLNPARLSSNAGQIGDEIVQHLNALVGANVEVTLEIHADVPDGVPEQVQRTVNENAKTLKFESWGFEED